MNRTSKWEMWELRYNVLVVDTGNSPIFLYSPQSFVSHVHRFLTNMIGLVDLETPIFFLKLVPTLVVFPPVSLIMCEYFYTDTSHLWILYIQILWILYIQTLHIYSFLNVKSVSAAVNSCCAISVCFLLILCPSMQTTWTNL